MDTQANRERFTEWTKRALFENKKLTKACMAYQIGVVEPHSPYTLFYDKISRNEIVAVFNEIFGTNIKQQ